MQFEALDPPMKWFSMQRYSKATNEGQRAREWDEDPEGFRMDGNSSKVCKGLRVESFMRNFKLRAWE